MSIIYILSQVFVIAEYALLATSYQLKDHKKILFVNFLSLIASGVSYLLLGAWTGLVMVGIAVCRNIYFIILNKKQKDSKKNSRADYFALAIFLVITAISTAITATNAMDVIFGIATMALTYSLWQKNPRVYKALGLPISIVRIGYNISIHSVFGIILESIFFTSVVISNLREIKRKKTKSNKK